MPLIVGLGNIGKEYEGTRHNAGFLIVDKLAETLRATFKEGRGPFLAAEGNHRGEKVILIKPTTYVNLSGQAVLRAMRIYNIPLQDILICIDDLNIPIGTVRLRPGGGDGGHNGLKNINHEVGSKKYSRLRFGIGNDYPRGQQVDFVLSSFDKEELPSVDEAVQRAHDAALCFVREGINRAMNLYN